MSKSNDWENYLLQLLFYNRPVGSIGDATGLPGSTASGSLYISLHTNSPSESGSQDSYEAAYGSYARVAVQRTSGSAGWTVTNNQVQNTSAINFPQATSGTETLTHAGIGCFSSGSGKLLYSGSLSPNISVSTGVTPIIPANGITLTEE